MGGRGVNDLRRVYGVRANEIMPVFINNFFLYFIFVQQITVYISIRDNSNCNVFTQYSVH